MQLLWPRTLHLGPPHVCTQPAPCDLTFFVCRCCTKWMSTSRFLTGDDDWQGKECRDIEGVKQNEVDVRHSQRHATTRDYVLQLPNYIRASCEASLRGQPRIHALVLRLRVTIPSMYRLLWSDLFIHRQIYTKKTVISVLNHMQVACWGVENGTAEDTGGSQVFTSCMNLHTCNWNG